MNLMIGQDVESFIKIGNQQVENTSDDDDIQYCVNQMFLRPIHFELVYK